MTARRTATVCFGVLGVTAATLMACSSPGGGGGGIFFPPGDTSVIGDLSGEVSRDGAVGTKDGDGPVRDDGATQTDRGGEDTTVDDVAKPPDVSDGTCEAGQTRCNGSSIEVCAPGGLSWNFIASCGQGQACSGGACCAPSCGGRNCGPDGCGGSCGTCSVGFSCDQGYCECKGSCAGKDCGDDGCGNSCGGCDDNEICQGTACVCQPQCSDVECGPNGCGGSCGTCGPGQSCDNGQCVCMPHCTGKSCGDDGCGGSCGICSAGKACTSGGACITPSVCGNKKCEADETEAGCPADCTVPKCAANQCGGQGTGGCYCDNTCKTSGDCCANVCDVCTSLSSCAEPCVPKCSGKTCGDDGCGGSCGTCAVGQACKANGSCGACTPSCSGKVCGDNGCGGSCGSCATGESCSAGECTEGFDCLGYCSANCTDPSTCLIGCLFAGSNPLTQQQLDCLNKTPCDLITCLVPLPSP